jgi:hypothetical protein
MLDLVDEPLDQIAGAVAAASMRLQASITSRFGAKRYLLCLL